MNRFPFRIYDVRTSSPLHSLVVHPYVKCHQSKPPLPYPSGLSYATAMRIKVTITHRTRAVVGTKSKYIGRSCRKCKYTYTFFVRYVYYVYLPICEIFRRIRTQS